MGQSQSRLDVLFPWEPDQPLLDKMRSLMRTLEARLQAAETDQATAAEQAEDLVNVGLARINDVLLPQVQRIQKLTSLGFLKATSNSNRSLAVGPMVFIVPEGDERDTFTPTAFVCIERTSDFTTWAIAQVVLYRKETGELSLNLLNFQGSSEAHNDWTISCAAAGSLASQAVVQQASEAVAIATAMAQSAAADAAQTEADRISANLSKISANDSSNAASASKDAAGASASAAAASAGQAQATVENKLDKTGDASNTTLLSRKPFQSPLATVYARAASDIPEEYGSILDHIPKNLQANVGAGDLSVPMDSYINALFNELRKNASPVYPTGRRIRWPNGKMRLENALGCREMHNIRLSGPGKSCAEIIQTVNAPVFSADLTAADIAAGKVGLARLMIEDLTIHGAWGANQGAGFNRAHGISTRYSNGVEARRVDFRGCNRMWNVAFAVGNRGMELTSPAYQDGNPLCNKYGIFQCGINPEYDNNSIHTDHCILSAQQVTYRMVSAHGSSHSTAVGLLSRVGMLGGRPGLWGDGEDPTDVLYPNTQFVYPHINDAEMDGCTENGFIFAGTDAAPISKMRMGLLWAGNTGGVGIVIDKARGLTIGEIQAVYGIGGGLSITNSSYVTIGIFQGIDNLRGAAFVDDIEVRNSTHCRIMGGTSQIVPGRPGGSPAAKGLAEYDGSDYNSYDLDLDNTRRGGTAGGRLGLYSEFRGYPWQHRKAPNVADTL